MKQELLLMRNITRTAFVHFVESVKSLRLSLLAVMLIVSALSTSVFGWGYKSAGGSWNDCTSAFRDVSFYTNPMGSSPTTYQVLMKTYAGGGFNVTKENNCSGQQ